jgi:hypothetical protein
VEPELYPPRHVQSYSHCEGKGGEGREGEREEERRRRDGMKGSKKERR